MLENPALEQMDTKLWDNTCELFLIKDKTKTSLEDLVMLKGFKQGKGLFPSQALAATFMATRRINPVLDLDGGFLADDPGLGKTVCIVGLIALMRWLWIAYDDMTTSHNGLAPSVIGRHLRPGTVETPQSEHVKCPTQHLWGVQCPCVESGVAHKIMKGVLPRGPTFIVPPPKAVGVWRDELVRFLDPSSSLKIEVFIYHSTHTKHFPRERYSELQCADDGKAPKNSEKFVFISTSKSFQQQLLRAFAKPYWYVPDGRKKPKRGNDLPGLAWGLLVRDELHKEHSVGTTLSQYFADPFHKKNRPFKWALSGTPFEKSPGDLAGHFRCLQQKPWEKPDHPLYIATEAGMKDLISDYKKLVSSAKASDDSDVQKVISQMYVLLRHVMIRRRQSSKFWDKKLLDLPPYKIRMVECPTKPAWTNDILQLSQQVFQELQKDFQERLQAWEDHGKHGQAPTMSETKLKSVSFLLRLCAGFPEFIRMHERDEEAPLRAKELDEQRVWADLKNSPYGKNVSALRASSSKMDKLFEVLALHLGKPAKGKRQNKVLIISNHPAVTAAIKTVSILLSPRYYPD